MVDDDLDMNALTKTNYVKSIVTAELRMDLERKKEQSYQGQLYVRFLCFGNGALTALHDRSDGFFRRQIILTTKDKPCLLYTSNLCELGPRSTGKSHLYKEISPNSILAVSYTHLDVYKRQIWVAATWTHG